MTELESQVYAIVSWGSMITGTASIVMLVYLAVLAMRVAHVATAKELGYTWLAGAGVAIAMLFFSGLHMSDNLHWELDHPIWAQAFRAIPQGLALVLEIRLAMAYRFPLFSRARD